MSTQPIPASNDSHATDLGASTQPIPASNDTHATDLGASTQPLLEIRDLSRSFGGIQAVTNVSLEIYSGESVGLIGPNGAGKTTLFNCICGTLAPDTGRILFEGSDITNLPVFRRASRGIGRTFQRLELFSSMTVREHLIVAARAKRGSGRLWKDLLNLGAPTRSEIAQAQTLVELLELADVASAPVDTLSLGKGRLVELGRALIRDPKLLLLDEPSSGLDSIETDSLIDTLVTLQSATNMAIVIVEHDLDVVVELTNRLYVLDLGKLIAQGETQSVIEGEELRSAYLGNVRDSSKP